MIDAKPMGVNMTDEKRVSWDTSIRTNVSAPSGKSMHQMIMNSSEEHGAYLHNFKNLNESRSRDSRKDNNTNLKAVAKSAFSVQQVGEIEEFSLALNNKHSNPADIMDKIKKFLSNFSHDVTDQNLALISIKDKLSDPDNRTEITDEIDDSLDHLLYTAKNSTEFKAGVLGYGIIGLAGQQDNIPLKTALTTTYPINLNDIETALLELREKFNVKNIYLATSEVYKEIAAAYHYSGRNIDKAELIPLMKGMSQLKTLLALYDECYVAARLLVPIKQQLTSTNLSAELLVEVVNLQKRSWVEISDVKRIANNLGLDSLAEKNILAVQLKSIMGKVPEHLFLQPEQKQQCLDVIFQVVDVSARQEVLGGA